MQSIQHIQAQCKKEYLQPFTFVNLELRVDSSAASKETVQTFTAELSKHQSLISGGADVVVLQKEIKACTSTEREKILSELHKGGFKVEVPVQQILTLKADLSIPWTKL